MVPDSVALTPDLKQRVFIENILPLVDGGHFPLKRCVGDELSIHATIHTDGIDQISAIIRYHPEHNVELQTTLQLISLGQDLWEGRFPVKELGRYAYSLHAWIDYFGTWRSALAKKAEAKQDIDLDLKEGAIQIHAAMPNATGADRKTLQHAAAMLETAGDFGPRVTTAQQPSLQKLMALYAPREPITSSAVFFVDVERARARTGAWYEMFPRSAGPTAERSATLREAEARLPGIAAMGFDVLYLPPVHPIGKKFRKGPNNNPQAKPGDPGSPWAIGSDEGGHKSIAPELGTFDDFDHFVGAAKANGLEVALDLAYQCAPDHPYAREHPEWFHHRPDGSIQYAENPPKKYEDIYPIDFECADWKALWHELKDVVLFWIQHEIKIFRVDNPHTKPFHFWEWLIHEIHAVHPDTIFLGEAFTRPAGMDSLAKVGFSQSYTYFTWRNTKEELTEYLTELTQTDLREYLRPNFFANTPDILHAFLQTGGRAAHQLRLVLAATLSASYGIYGPTYELCDARAFPGTEDYVDSEKYQVRQWNWDAPGNIKPLITRVNRIRHENSALQLTTNLLFYPIDNPVMLAYGKISEDRTNFIVTIVNLDPFNAQSGWVSLPESLGLPEHFDVQDLLTDRRFSWQRGGNFVRLDPNDQPAHILKIPYAAR